MKEGTDYFYNKKYDEALSNFKEEFKTNPSNEVKFWIAHCYAEKKEIALAKPLFLEIINSNDNGPEILMSLENLGTCYAVTKQIDSALYYYNKVIELAPNQANTYFNKGQLYYNLSKFDEAKLNFDKAIELKKNDWWYYQKRLEVSFATQNYSGALTDLKKVKELKPDTKNDVNFAYCYSMLKMYNEADSIFQIIYNGNDPYFLNNYGFNKHNMGKTKEGKEIILKSISLNPKNSYAYRNLAIIAIDEKNNKNICKYLSKAKELNFRNDYGSEVDELLLKHCN